MESRKLRLLTKFILLISSKDRTCIQISHMTYRNSQKCLSGRSDKNNTLGTFEQILLLKTIRKPEKLF